MFSWFKRSTITNSIFALCMFTAPEYAQAVECFANQRFPKVVQYEASPTENQGTAVALHEATNSLFVAGQVTQLEL